MAREDPVPLRVGLMDDDFGARKWNVSLLMRDPRTTVVVETGTPGQLLRMVAQTREVDVVVLDVEYGPEEPCLGELIGELQRMAPAATVVCLAQYGRPEDIQAGLESGAQGFLLKNEVRVSITAAVIRAAQGRTVISAGILPHLKGGQDSLLSRAVIVPPWEPNPRITPRLEQAFWLRVFYGMRAREAAQELGVKKRTVEKYLAITYELLPDGTWADDSYLQGLDAHYISGYMSAEDEAWLWFSLPPVWSAQSARRRRAPMPARLQPLAVIPATRTGPGPSSRPNAPQSGHRTHQPR